MNNQFEENFALAKKHENELIACLEDYFGSSFSPAELGEDKYRKIDYFSNCDQKFAIGARVCRPKAWKYRAQVTINNKKTIHKSEHDEWMVEGKGPDYFIYGHIAPDGKALRMVVLVSLNLLRTKKGTRYQRDNHDFFVYPITDPGVVLFCWHSPEVRDDHVIKILSCPKKILGATPLHTNTEIARLKGMVREKENEVIDLSKRLQNLKDAGTDENKKVKTNKKSRLRRYQYSAVAAVLLLSGVVFGNYLDLGIDRDGNGEQTQSTEPNLIALETDQEGNVKQTESPKTNWITPNTDRDGNGKQTESSEPNLITPEDAMTHLGQIRTVCGEVASSKYAVNSTGKPTYLNIGKPYPDHIFTAVIWEEHRAQFGTPEQRYKEKWVCVTGKITEYRGVAQIEIKKKKDLHELDGPTSTYVKKFLSGHGVRQ